MRRERVRAGSCGLSCPDKDGDKLMRDWHAFRNEFPAVSGSVYLNTAGGGAMSRAAAEAGAAYYREHLELADAAWEKWLARMETVRRTVAHSVGAQPDRLSFLSNASLAFNIIARSLPKGARVVALDNEFPSCTLPFLGAGHQVRFVSTPPSGAISADDLDRALRASDDLFVISSVQFATGYRADIRSLAEACHARGIDMAVDATQSVHAFPLDMGRDGVDWLVFSGYKWATAGYGIAVLASRAGAKGALVRPPLSGWRSARDAYALVNDRLDLLSCGVGHEMGHPLFPGIFTLGAATRLLAGGSGGTKTLSHRILGLVSRLRAGLCELGCDIRSWNPETAAPS